MCMGFAFFRSGTEGMMEFQHVFMETLLQTGDDQVVSSKQARACSYRILKARLFPLI